MPSLVLGSARAIFEITLSQPGIEPVSVDWYTVDGTAIAGRDYETNSGTVVFSPGETSKSVEVFISGRTVETEDRVFYIRMRPPVNAILADEIGACVIHVDTTGSQPVVTVIYPKGAKGDRGFSAYEIALQNGFSGTEAEWLASLRPSPEEIAPLVAPLIDAGQMVVTAAGTASKPTPDTHDIAQFAGRIAYMRQAKIAIAPALTAGTNVVPVSAFVGDTIDASSTTGCSVMVLRAGVLVAPAWTYLPITDEISITGAVAGDIPVVVQRDIGAGDIAKVHVEAGGVSKPLQDWLGEFADSFAELFDHVDPASGAGKIGRAIRYISSKAELRSLVPQYDGERVYLVDAHTDLLSLGAGGHGVFKWKAGVMVSQVAGDPLGGLYVALASDPGGGTGAWVREWDGVHADPKWWGFDAAPRGMNSANLPVSLLKNREGATQDTWVLLFGDSHGWGQGAPDSQDFIKSTLYSVHSANLYNKGFMRRIERDISDRRGFFPCTYGAWIPSQPAFIRPGFYQADAIERSKRDPSQVFPIIPLCGTISGATQAIASGASTNLRFYSPVARGAAVYQSLFREKLEVGMFGARRIKLNLEQLNDFKDAGKTEYFQISANPNRGASGAGFTTYSNPSGGVYAEVTIATNLLVVHTSQFFTNLPSWMQAGGSAFVPGYGIVKVLNLVNSAGGTDIALVTEAGAALGGTAFIRCLRDGMRFYHPSYVQRAVFRVPMQGPARVAYVSVLHKSGGGMLDLFFADILNSGGGADPVFGGAAKSLTSTGWSWGAAPGSAATISGPGPNLLPAPKTSITANTFRIDTSEITAGVTEEVVYRIDFGATQYGDLYLEASGGTVEFRGLTLDNNKVVNLSMGGHTIGAWLGLEPSFSDPAQDHIAQILEHVPVQPSHIITQIPFVNEFLYQTPIATFKARLQAFVDRFKNHLPSSNNFNARGVDFLFFISLANREILFGVGAEPGVKYSDYVQAAKEFCAANGHAFVDCQADLVGKVRSGQIDVERLYSDSNHPSDYANECIYSKVRETLAAII